MIIEPTSLPGTYVIRRERFADTRGSFSRMLCRRELTAAGLHGDIAQVNLSENINEGTLRGLHLQQENDAEDKIVTCAAGKIYDVCADVRTDSATFGQWFGIELTDENGLALYVPKGCAHGYLTLTDNTHVLYFVTQYYKKDAETGYRYDDPVFNISWPLAPPFIVSDKDSRWPYLRQHAGQST